MKIFNTLAIAGVFILAAFNVRAQTQGGAAPINTSPASPPAGQSPYPVVPSAAAAFPASLSLGLGWNESYRTGISVPINNTATTQLTILGVQTSANLFVESFPSTVAASGQASISLIYFSKFNSNGDSDVVRVLTSNGEVDIPVAHARTPAFQLSVQQLVWHVNDPLTPQSVTLTMSANTAAPQAAMALGASNLATISDSGNNTFQITVTPGSTASVGSFPVIVTLNPTLPGGPVVISCDIKPSS